MPLPELTPCSGRADRGSRADVEIRLASLPDAVAELRARPTGIAVSEREARFIWDDAGAFVVRDGREILVQPHPGADERLVRLGILGPAMAALLQQLGIVALHASAVRMDDAIIAFLGASGAGKSTLAAAFHRCGAPVVTDDTLAVRLHDGAVLATPGFAHLRLWPDSVTALGGDPGALARCEPDREKRVYPTARERIAHEPLPLRRLYVLADGDTPAVERLSPAESFLALVANSYGIDWMHDVSGRADFLARAEIARRVPVRRLRRPDDLALLSWTVACVEDDLARDA
ncbi:MAG TPA: hypothetical protein VFS44_12545 [Gemmatimonadaceae bacterium]|nr:hypothetical protein [Gemmatimonadaceae bacterium]